ncbi:MAG: O-methyltransferase, partial [Candidatus Sulfotelmatobacter sp.]
SLVSIEDAPDAPTQERFKFNVPLGSIELKFGHSNAELPKLPWETIRTVCWLDYDGSLAQAALADIRFMASRMAPGSLLAVTVDARLENESDIEPPLDRLIAQIGDERKVPTHVMAAKKLLESEVKTVLRTIMTQELTDGINERNAGIPAEQQMTFEQIFNFEYRDKAPMLTVGWVIFDEGQRPRFNECAFQKLKFVRSGDEPFIIAPPFLTPHEMREIDKCDAQETYRSSDLPVPDEERKKYEGIRRYWPTGGYAEMS